MFQILPHILSYLPVKSIKNCRSVAPLWNIQGCKILQKRCSLVLKFRWWHDEYPENSAKIARYLVEMKEIPLQNWNIKIFSVKRYPEATIMNDVSRCLSHTEAQNIKKLSLGSEIDCAQDYEVHLKILAALQATLEELEFFVFWRWITDQPSFFTNIRFPLLQAFILDLKVGCLAINSEGPLCKDLASAIGAVTSIQIKSTDSVARTFLEELSNSPASAFPSLNKINIPTPNPDLI